ncbi:hypothetical protein ACFL24_00025 [Patescibacteria group bacterium]
MLKKILPIIILFFILSLPLGVFASTPKVTFEYPDEIKAGESFILELNVNHQGQSKSDYVNQIKLYGNSEPLKIWSYTTKTKSKDAKWIEKITVSLDEATVLKAEIITTKKEEAEKEDFLEVTGAEEVAEATTQEETAGATEKTSDFGLTFWIFVVVVVIVIAVVIVYTRRKRKGLI